MYMYIYIYVYIHVPLLAKSGGRVNSLDNNTPKSSTTDADPGPVFVGLQSNRWASRPVKKV